MENSPHSPPCGYRNSIARWGELQASFHRLTEVPSQKIPAVSRLFFLCSSSQTMPDPDLAGSHPPSTIVP